MNKLLESFLRSDHAGEVGAVYIYKGILSIAKDPALVEFSKRHLEYLYERLDMKKKLKDIHEQVKANNINDFYESDVFTITNLTTSEE